MIKQVYFIDNDGFYIDAYVINTETNMYYDADFEWKPIVYRYVSKQPPIAKKVKWDGTKWVITEPYVEEVQ